jgi:pilus assembly protein FimV
VEPAVAETPVAVPAVPPEPPVVAAPPVQPAPAAPVESTESRPAEPVAEEKTAPPVTAPAVAERAAPAPIVEPAPVAAPPRPAQATGFAALLQDPASLVGIGIAGLGVLGALLWAVGGRRRKPEEDEAAAVPPAAEPEAAKATPPVPAVPAEIPPAAAAPVAALAPAAAAVAATGAVRAETVEPERVSTEDLAALELSTTDLFGLKGETTEVDPTEEADVYIAYGRYEQAEQLLRLALEMEPGRLALKHKLLEVYFASRDASAFGSLFGEMQAAGGEAEDPAGWQRALRMGRQLDPASPAYSGTALADEDLEAALREAERGLAADLEAAEPDFGALKIDTHYAEAAPDLDGGSVLNDLSLDLGTEEASDKGSHPFKLDVSEELSELRTPTGLSAELDDNDLAKAGALGGGFSLDEITGQDLEQAQGRAPDLSGIELTMETPGADQDTTLVHADTTLELVDDVETKLDLARAYIELGDGEGARVMLREVMQEGNDAQKANAEAMLKELA